MGKHSNSFIDDETEDEKTKKKKRNHDAPLLDVEEELQGNTSSVPSHNNSTITDTKKRVQKKQIVSPPPAVAVNKINNEEDEAIEALMLDSTVFSPSFSFAGRTVIHIDRTAADIYGQKLKGGITIAYVNYHNTDESAYVMQLVTAISRSMGSFPDLGIKHIALRAQRPNTNDTKKNMDKYAQHIFVMIDKHCPKLKQENGLSFILGIFANWLNSHTFSKKENLLEKSGFCKYRLATDFDQTHKDDLRKLGDIIILSDAIAIVRELFPMELERNLFEQKVIPAYFSKPYPTELCQSFQLIQH